MSKIISHEKSSSPLEEIVKSIKNRIQSTGNLSHTTVKEQCDILEELTKFPLGRYLLERGGVNAYWTDYTITQSQIDNLDPKKLNPIEDFIFNHSPVIRAHRERMQMYAKEASKLLKEGVIFSSIPCGVMRDLLMIEYGNMHKFQIYGIDLDPEALELAKNLAGQRNLSKHVILQQKDAWHLDVDDKFDLIISHGLNVYEPNRERILALYRQFWKALKPGGILLISTLTPPPEKEIASEWIISPENQEEIRMDRVIFYDVIKPKWQNFKTSKELCQELCESGFLVQSIFHGSFGMVPVVNAKRL